MGPVCPSPARLGPAGVIYLHAYLVRLTGLSIAVTDLCVCVCVCVCEILVAETT